MKCSLTVLHFCVDVQSVDPNEGSSDVLRPDPIFAFRRRRSRSRSFGDDLHHVGLVDPIGDGVAQLGHDFQDLGFECIQGQGSDFGDVNPEAPVDAGASDAEADPEVDRSPDGIGGTTVATFFVA